MCMLRATTTTSIISSSATVSANITSSSMIYITSGAVGVFVFTVKIDKQSLIFQIKNTLITYRIDQIDPRTCANYFRGKSDE